MADLGKFFKYIRDLVEDFEGFLRNSKTNRNCDYFLFIIQQHKTFLCSNFKNRFSRSAQKSLCWTLATRIVYSDLLFTAWMTAKAQFSYSTLKTKFQCSPNTQSICCQLVKLMLLDNSKILKKLTKNLQKRTRIDPTLLQIIGLSCCIYIRRRFLW